jgi:hypothetical protein
MSVLAQICPLTSKTHTRGPRASTHARNEPGPALFKFVTLWTVVHGLKRWRPLPPMLRRPCPSAPGNAASVLWRCSVSEHADPLDVGVAVGLDPDGVGVRVAVGVAVLVGAMVGVRVRVAVEVGDGVDEAV